MAADNHLFESGLTGDVGQARVKWQPGWLAAGQRLHAAGRHSWTRPWLLSFERCRRQGEQTEETAASQETNLTWEMEARYVLFYFACERFGGGASADQVKNAFRILMSDTAVKAVFINIFGGILRCDVLATGVVAASKDLQLKVPVVVRMEGTNVELGQQILRDSGLNFTIAAGMKDGAQKVVALAGGAR